MRLFAINAILCFCLTYTSIGLASPIVELETTAGTIVLELDDVHAPETVKNFVQYVEDGFYTDTIFHRVIANFMIQGGGMNVDMKEKKTYPPIKNEADNGLTNDKYTIAMARTGNPDSATSQFFINTQKNSFLNFKSKTPEGYGYCVFGKVIEGMHTVDKIEKSKTQTVGYFENAPVTPVIITKASIRQPS